MVFLELYDYQGYGKKQCKIQAYDTSETLELELIANWNHWYIYAKMIEIPQIYP